MRDGVDEQKERQQRALLPGRLLVPHGGREGIKTNRRGDDEGPEAHVERPQQRQGEAEETERPAPGGKLPHERDEAPRDEQDGDAQRGLQAVAPAEPRVEGLAIAVKPRDANWSVGTRMSR